MLIPTADRKKIYQYLFKEGVMVAKKDFEQKQHPALPGIRNLYVIKALQSLESRGYVKVQFNWQYYFYTLTDDGIQYLRDFLHLPADIVPATFKKLVRPAGAPGKGPRQTGGAVDGEQQQQQGGEYRRRSAEKKEVAPGGFKPEFRGGAGRGKRE